MILKEAMHDAYMSGFREGVAWALLMCLIAIVLWHLWRHSKSSGGES